MARPSPFRPRPSSFAQRIPVLARSCPRREHRLHRVFTSPCTCQRHAYGVNINQHRAFSACNLTPPQAKLAKAAGFKYLIYTTVCLRWAPRAVNLLAAVRNLPWGSGKQERRPKLEWGTGNCHFGAAEHCSVCTHHRFTGEDHFLGSDSVSFDGPQNSGAGQGIAMAS